MKKFAMVHATLAALLSTGFALAQAQPSNSANASGTVSSSKASDGSSAKKKVKKAKKPQSSASNPGTTGGAGNRSGGEAKDGASFEAPRPGAAASKPTGTGWD